MFNPKAVYSLLQELEEGSIIETNIGPKLYQVKREQLNLEITDSKGKIPTDYTKVCVLDKLLTKPKMFRSYKEPMTLKEVANKYKYFKMKEGSTFVYTLDEDNTIVLFEDPNPAHLTLEDIQEKKWIGSDEAELL